MEHPALTVLPMSKKIPKSGELGSSSCLYVRVDLVWAIRAEVVDVEEFGNAARQNGAWPASEEREM